MSKAILGLSCHFHDSAACLIRNGEIIAAAQEERFTRIKNDASFPRFAINYCLEEAQLDEANLSAIAYYEDPLLVLDRVGREMIRQNRRISRVMFKRLWRRWKHTGANLENPIRAHLPDFNGQIHCTAHHQAHAAAAFYPSPFEEACILTIDGVGEWATATICYSSGGEIELLREMVYPDSVGLFYSAATNYLGFKVNSGEYKVMGLAPYGEPQFLDTVLESIIHIYDDGSVSLNPDFFDFTGLSPIATPAWDDLFALPRRDPESDLKQRNMDIAASVQKATEDAMLKMAHHAKDLTGSRNLCLSGGVALNCVGNGQILRQRLFDNIWIQPAAGDAGNALGAALALWNHDHSEMERPKAGCDMMKGARLGPQYSSEEITDFLDFYGFPYEVLDEDDIPRRIVDQIESGGVIGLFDGRMEFGPRALGARSIIADPRDVKMQATVNLKVKFRESFRPFAPVVREENASEWFDLDTPSPYMLLVAPLREEQRLKVKDDVGISLADRLSQQRSKIPAVTQFTFRHVFRPFLENRIRDCAVSSTNSIAGPACPF